MNTRTLPITVIALLAASPAIRVLAQQPAAPVAAEAAATPPAGTVPVAAAVRADDTAGTASRTRDAAGRDTLSVDFPDEDIRNILRNVADLFELNIIMPDTLQGKTTIKLRDVTWRQIFQSVLQPVNYTYVEDGNIIKIISNDSLLQEPNLWQEDLLLFAQKQNEHNGHASESIAGAYFMATARVGKFTLMPGVRNEWTQAKGTATVRNTGTSVWLPSSIPLGGVKLGVHLYDESGLLVDRDYARADLPGDRITTPGDEVTVPLELPAPDAGRWQLGFDLVAEGVCWFEVNGAETMTVPLHVP
jgi:hypothetical protein